MIDAFDNEGRRDTTFDAIRRIDNLEKSQGAVCWEIGHFHFIQPIFRSLHEK